jgi:hypothetical protein
MNYQYYKSSRNDIVFCIIDNTDSYANSWTRELIKNQSDFNVTNINSKGYDIYQGFDEDTLLALSCEKNYKYAVVFSTGTEFINGLSFFFEIEKLIKDNVFIAGHILDRGDAFYELHHQCYLLNLEEYKKLKCPSIGKQELGAEHKSLKPLRSAENWHDDYTPKWVAPGNTVKNYNHKCHGWNILKIAFDNNLKVSVFDEQIRNSKKHYYPENQTEFLNHVQWAYQRLNYCANTFVHKSNTEITNQDLKNVEQIVTTASGLFWIPFLNDKNSRVVLYDYNQNSLDYWKSNLPKLKNVSYDFIKVDLLTDNLNLDFLDRNKKTFINLSNIFAYEGTSFFYNLDHRIYKENQALSHIRELLPESIVNFSGRAATGFINLPLYGMAKELKNTDTRFLLPPTWHNKEWI